MAVRKEREKGGKDAKEGYWEEDRQDGRKGRVKMRKRERRGEEEETKNHKEEWRE